MIDFQHLHRSRVIIGSIVQQVAQLALAGRFFFYNDTDQLVSHKHQSTKGLSYHGYLQGLPYRLSFP
jgi:hypothetical protein